MKEIIVLYPGRFQPFSKHHYAVYLHLVQKFGDKVKILTSNKVDENSPFDFNLKRDIINGYGIKNVEFEQAPYQPKCIEKFPANTIVIMALGEKDSSRIRYTKKDGTPGYYQPFNSIDECEYYSKHSYVYITPHIDVKLSNGEPMSGTNVRSYLSKADAGKYLDAFGWYQTDIAVRIDQALNGIAEDITIPIEVGDTILGGRFKNKKIVVKTIGKNDKGDITINDRPLLKYRITKENK